MQFEDYKRIFSNIMDDDMHLYSNQYDIWQLLLDMKETLSFNDKDVRDYAMTISKYTHELATYKAAETGSGDFDDLYWKLLLLEAPYLFESYLLYLEKNRVDQNKFYEPKKVQLNKHGLIKSMQDLEDDVLDILSISMPPGTQKAQPLYSKVLTPDGFIRMGDVRVGTKVISGIGNVCNVTGVYPQGVKPIYEITFDDGSKCRCSDEHLWTVQTRDDRRRKNADGTERYRTVTLKSMLNNYKVGNVKRNNYSVDYMPKFDFPTKAYPIPPYVMGVFIGDGCSSSGNLNISTKDHEVVDRFNELMDGVCYLQKKTGDNVDYRIKDCEKHRYSVFRKGLSEHGLDGCKSEDKFIPKAYMLGDYTQRLELLRGLMDTDGSASNKNGYCVFATISEKLADDIAELVHSLGGFASVHDRYAMYKGKADRHYFEIIIEFSAEMESIFCIARKQKTYCPKRKVIKRFITNIEYIGEEECQCIYIDCPSHLYVTDNYIITHNTTLEKFFASWVIGRHPDDYNLFYSHSGDITRMFYDGVLDITTNATEYRWNEIFPAVILKSTDAKREQINFNSYKPFPNLQCSSVGAKNAGKVRCNRYLFCDDLIGGIEEALSKPRLDKLWSIYAVDARQRKLNEQVKEIHICTRWSTQDIIARLIRIYEGSDRCRFIAVPDIDPVTGESNFNYKYNGMSVEFFHDQEKAMDEVSYRCLYKNDPIDREGSLYHEDDLKRYMELPLYPPDAILSIADTKNKGTDYFFQPVLLKYGEDYYLTDCVCSNESDYEVQYQNSTNLIIRNKVEAAHYESNNGGDRVSFEVNKRLKAAGYYCNITQEFTTANKETKIIIYAPWVKEHVYFKDKSMYTAKEDYGVMMGQLLGYSTVGKNTHDDVCDGLASFAKRQGAPKPMPARIIKSPI